MTTKKKAWLIVAFLVVMAWYGYHTSSSGGGGGANPVCEQEYQNMTNPVETRDQFMQHCTADFNRYTDQNGDH